MSNILRIVKLSANAYTPERGSEMAAGLDLKAAHDGVVLSHGNSCIATDLSIELPIGTYGRIAGRSGLALNNNIVVGGGVVDPDYRGNLKVILINHGKDTFVYRKGDKIAQLICEKISFPEVEEVLDLSTTRRGDRGFGSTGLN